MEQQESPENHKPTTGKAAGEAKNDENPSRWKRFREWVKRESSFTDWCIAGFTLVLAAASIFQFIVIGGQLDVMRKDERAWLKYELSGDPVEGNPDRKKITVTAGQSPTVQVKFINVGKGAARKLRGKIYVECVDAEKEPHLERIESDQLFPGTIFVAGILFPTNAAETPADRERWKNINANLAEPDPLTESELAALLSGKAYMAVYGMILYEDVFGTPHWTKFCSWTPFATGGQFQASRCTQYNEADSN